MLQFTGWQRVTEMNSTEVINIDNCSATSYNVQKDTKLNSYYGLSMKHWPNSTPQQQERSGSF